MVSSAIRDITKRKRELTELRTAEELFRGAFDGSPRSGWRWPTARAASRAPTASSSGRSSTSRAAWAKETIAEHVGDAATVALLRELGVTHGQGFHLGKPQPLERFLAESYRRPAALAYARGRLIPGYGSKPTSKRTSPAKSKIRTTICSVSPSIWTSPANWRPADGG